MKRVIFSVIFSTIFLIGCGSVNQMNNDLNDSLGQIMGVYTAPTLASYPRPSGCSESKCRQLDQLEVKGYELARQKKITWTKLVSAFYEGRAKLYPDSNDGTGTSEFISFQRVLAEQMDAGKITETQWAYLVDKKFSEVQSAKRGAGGQMQHTKHWNKCIPQLSNGLPLSNG